MGPLLPLSPFRPPTTSRCSPVRCFPPLSLSALPSLGHFRVRPQGVRPRSAEMMHMTFYWGRKVTLLFHWWRTKTWAGYALTIAAVFLAAAFYQYMEARRLRFRALTLLQPSTFPGRAPVPSVDAPLLGFSAARRAAAARAAVAVLFGVNSSIGYLLMLSIMSYNGGVFVAIVVGLAVGYLVFRSGGEEDVIHVGKPCGCP